jgi:hypothetical protein
MALETDALTTYTAIGNREDLSDIIFDVSPTETPVLTTIKKRKATGVKHEWQIDALADASSSNFVLEGDAATVDAADVTTRVFNYCCISDKVPRVTGTQEAVLSAGRKSEMAYQMQKRMKELKRDVEKIILENNAEVAGNATLVRECSGLQAWVKTNTDIAGDATASAGNGTDAHTDGTARALTEAQVEGVLAAAWSSGGNPTMGVLNSFQKRKFSGFSGNATRFDKAEDKKVTNSVDVYIDPLGNEVRLVPDRYAPADVCYFIDPEYLAFATLRDFQTHDLAKTGDTERKQILVEYTLEVCNEKAHAGIYDLSSS